MNLVINVEKTRYEDFVCNHPTKSHFMQSYAWGEFSKTKGLIPHYLGLEDKNKLVATALLLQKKLWFGYSYFYVPRGYVLDYQNKEVLETFTEVLKKYVKKQKGIFIKIDPDLKLCTLNEKGEILKKYEENYNLINELKKIGYKHFGFNQNFENTQPRYTFRLDLTNSIDKIKNNMHATTRKIINRDNPYNLKVYTGNKNDIKDFAKLMKITGNRDSFLSSSYDYYYNFFTILNKYNMCDIYTIKVSLKDVIKKTNDMIEELEEEIKKYDNKKKGKKQDLIAKLNRLELDLNHFKEYQSKYADKVFISSIITVKYGDKVWTVHGGNHNILRELNANYLIYYQILLDAKANNYKIMDFFGTSGNPTPDNPVYGIHLFKKRFGGEYIEFIGEFDLITNKSMYFIFQKLIPIYRQIKRNILKSKQKN